MKGKYEIQPISGHPAPEWRAQFDGDIIDDVIECSRAVRFLAAHELLSFAVIIDNPVHIRTDHFSTLSTVKTHIAPLPFNPFSMMRNK